MDDDMESDEASDEEAHVARGPDPTVCTQIAPQCSPRLALTWCREEAFCTKSPPVLLPDSAADCEDLSDCVAWAAPRVSTTSLAVWHLTAGRGSAQQSRCRSCTAARSS